MNNESSPFPLNPLEVDSVSRLAGLCGTRTSGTATRHHYDMALLMHLLPLSIARRFCTTTAQPCPFRFPLNTAMPQIGDQPHSRTGSRRHTCSNNAVLSTENHQGFAKKTIEVVVMTFVIMSVASFLALTFLRYVPDMAAAAAAGSYDHHFSGKGKRFTMHIFVSPSLSSPPPIMQLRGSRKPANRESSTSGSGGNDLKERLNSLEGNEGLEIDIIAQEATDAASKASQAAVEAGIAAVAAAVEETTISAGAALEGKPWGVSLTTE